jgi:hypothetical protein
MTLIFCALIYGFDFCDFFNVSADRIVFMLGHLFLFKFSSLRHHVFIRLISLVLSVFRFVLQLQR